MSRRIDRLAVAVCVAAACASTSGVTRHPFTGRSALPDPHFPTPARLESLVASTPRRPPSPQAARTTVAEWTLEGPLSTTLVQRGPAADTFWTPILRDALAQRSDAQITEDMQCVARETGRFAAQNNQLPAQDLIEFIVARCGSLGRNVAFSRTTVPVPDAVSNDEVLRVFRERYAPQFASMLPQGAFHAGLWVGRHDGRAEVLFGMSQPTVDIEPGPLTPDATAHVTIRGTLLDPNARTLVGLVNQGRSGVAYCTRDSTVTLPAFALSCEVKREDANAWIELTTTYPGTHLFRPVAQLLAWSAAPPSAVFTRAAPYVGASDAPDASTQLLGLVNMARADAHLAPLAVASAQTASACRLAPLLADVIEGGVDPEVANTATLGVLAGWDVQGLVRDARFVSYAHFGTRDLGIALATNLQEPTARFALFQPDASAGIACEVDDTTGAPRALLFGTYTLVDTARRSADERRVLEALTRARAARGLQPVHSFADVRPVVAQTIAALEAGRTDASAGLHDITDESVDVARRSIRAWDLETLSFDLLEFPPQLLSEPDLDVAIGVGYWRPPGRPWAHLVIYFVAAASEE